MLFLKDNFYCIINQDKFETFEQFIDRGYFIICQKPKNIADYEDIIKFSRIYINNKYLKCQYNETITIKLYEMIKKL